MKAQHISIFWTLSLIAYFTIQFTVTAAAGHMPQDLIGGEKNRRILHQPLYPASSAPPPESKPPPSPPPPTPANPEFPNPDQPFFPEVPTGQTPDQVQPSSPALANGTAVPNPVPTPAQQSKPTKKVAIAISVGIVTLGMLSALAFYLYRHRAKQPDESQKLVAGNSQRINEESRLPPSTFLYIGTVEPSTQTSVAETNAANASPYRKLNSVKRSDRYRPSPDLQPLPPLTKPPPPPAINSPPPMSSSDEESHDTAFYTPQGSSVSNEEGSYTPSSRQSQRSNNTSLVTQSRAETHVNSSVPHSKRTSRLFASSPDIKHAIIPSIKKSPTPPPPPPLPPLPIAYLEQPSQQSHPKPSKPGIPYTPKQPKFSSPPPVPDMARLQPISNEGRETSKAPLPPPPPPPPPRRLLSVPRKLDASAMNTPPVTSRQPILPKSRSPHPKEPTFEKEGPKEESNESTNSSERHDGDDVDGLKPKLKPLHWDKVRATSDRATVWDQLKSSSFQLSGWVQILGYR